MYLESLGTIHTHGQFRVPNQPTSMFLYMRGGNLRTQRMSTLEWEEHAKLHTVSQGQLPELRIKPQSSVNQDKNLHDEDTWCGGWILLVLLVQVQSSSAKIPSWLCLHPSNNRRGRVTPKIKGKPRLHCPVWGRSLNRTCILQNVDRNYLINLWSRFIVGFGIFGQKINVLGHGTDGFVMSHLSWNNNMLYLLYFFFFYQA